MNARSILLNMLPQSVTERIRARRWQNRVENGILFEGHDRLFKDVMATCVQYIEFGCGESTIWTDRNTNARIASVDTSSEWIKRTSDLMTRQDHSLRHVDCGALGRWGRPKTLSHRTNFMVYVKQPWEILPDADTVLIDGRFRIQCFLFSYIFAPEGTRIICDDYVSRPLYRIMEEFCPPVKLNKRQALFVLPSKNSRKSDDANELLQGLRYAID
jgi:hypothetical protein